MKKPSITSSLLVTVIVLLISSCSRGITIQEAANGKARCGRYIR